MRRGKIFLFILLVSSFFIFLNGASSKVLISRVRVSGATTSTDEFVELYNFSSSTECLWNWSLKKITSSGGIYNLVSSFPSTTILNPFSYYLITHADYSGISPDLLYTNENYSLANNNSLVLLDASDNSVDQIFWGNVSATVGLSLQNPEPGEAFVRLPNDEAGNYLDSDDTSLDFFLLSDPPFNSTSPSRPLWLAPTTTEPEQLPTSTPNIEAGAGYDPDLWSYLKINEIHPNPETGDEWVELFNTTSTGFNLDGGVICDDREENCEIGKLNGFVESRGFFTFFLTSSKLNNDGDSVILKNPEGLNLDQFSYGSGKLPQKGQSIARVIDGIDTDNDSDWSVTLSLTPGQPNSISLPPPTIYAGAVLQETGSTSETKSESKTPKTKKETPVSIVWNLSAPSITKANSSTYFDVHLSADPRGGTNLYAWDFGDGNIIEGSKVFHTFASSGIFSVKIFATSTQGTTGTTSFMIKAVPENSYSENIYLSEISPLPEKGEEEYIIISSRATTSTDLAGWKIGIEGERWYTLPAGTSISPGNTLTFYRTATKLPLNNEEGKVYLSDPNGKILDLAAYSNGKIDESFVLMEDGWQWKNRTEQTEEKQIETKKTKVLGVKINNYYRNVTLADAHSLPTGSLVSVEGKVESLPGAPGSNYFYIRDSGTGMQIYSYKKEFPKLLLGDVVRVSGEIGASQGTNRIKTKSALSIKVTSGGNGFFPEEKTISEIDENDYGTLLSVQGEITELKSNHFYLDDGLAEIVVSIPTKASIDRKGLVEGSTVRVSGILEKTANGWRLVPRNQGDISLINGFRKEVESSDNGKQNYLLVSLLGLSLILTSAYFKYRNNFKK